MLCWVVGFNGSQVSGSGLTQICPVPCAIFGQFSFSFPRRFQCHFSSFFSLSLRRLLLLSPMKFRGCWMSVEGDRGFTKTRFPNSFSNSDDDYATCVCLVWTYLSWWSLSRCCLVGLGIGTDSFRVQKFGFSLAVKLWVSLSLTSS